jgi:hypothetical protein
MAARFGYLPVSPGKLLTEEALDRILAGYLPRLEAIGGERWSAATSF